MRVDALEREATYDAFRRWFPVVDDIKVLRYGMDMRYNCIGYSLNMKRWVWPMNYASDDSYWPEELSQSSEHIDNFLKMYRMHGYTLAAKRDTPDIVVYGEPYEVTHATKRLPGGMWGSKLGAGELIAHPTAEYLNGGTYGDAFMRLVRRGV